MKTRLFLFPAAIAAFLMLNGTALGENVPVWAWEQLLKPWYEAYNAEDAEALADMYTPDAEVLGASGRSEIIKSFKALWQETRFSCSGGYDGFRIVGDLATGWGHDVCTQTPKGGGETETIASKWIAVYERQEDGSWLGSRDNGMPTSHVDGFLPAAGHWSVEEEHWDGPDASMVRATSDWDIKIMPGGHFVDTSGSRNFSDGNAVTWIEVWGVDPRSNEPFQHFVDSSGAFGNGSFEWVGNSWRSTTEVVSADGAATTVSCALDYSDDYNAFDGKCSGYASGETWVAYSGRGRRAD